MRKTKQSHPNIVNRVELSLTGKRIAMRYCREQTLNPRRTRDESAVFALPVVTARS